MKVLFLDVDGVLCINAPDFDVTLGHFCQEALTQLARVIHATGAKIVLHSSWRCHPVKIALLNKALETVNLPHIFECTKLTYQHEVGERTFTEIRVDEILHWLEQQQMRADEYLRQEIAPSLAVAKFLQNKTAKLEDNPRVSKWVAVDDMALHEDGRLFGHFVRTHEYVGLTSLHADALIHILGEIRVSRLSKGVRENSSKENREVVAVSTSSTDESADDSSSRAEAVTPPTPGCDRATLSHTGLHGTALTDRRSSLPIQLSRK